VEAEEIWQRVKTEEKHAEGLRAAAEAESEAVLGAAFSRASGRAVEGDAVVLFAKWPAVGVTKTRLAVREPDPPDGECGRPPVSIGVEGACTLARAMVKDMLSMMGTAPELMLATKV
jgi:hypothetical protein